MTTWKVRKGPWVSPCLTMGGTASLVVGCETRIWILRHLGVQRDNPTESGWKHHAWVRDKGRCQRAGEQGTWYIDTGTYINVSWDQELCWVTERHAQYIHRGIYRYHQSSICGFICYRLEGFVSCNRTPPILLKNKSPLFPAMLISAAWQSTFRAQPGAPTSFLTAVL